MSLDVASPGPVVAAAPGRRARWLARAATTPGRLRRVGAVLVAGCLAAALISVLAGAARTDAVRDGNTRLAALTADAATLYQSLADADAMATSGYVSGGLEPAAVRARYDADIARAADRLVHAGGLLPGDDPATALIGTIAGQLPVYTGLIETARTYNRQGLPLGQSYLDSASRLMRSTILPAADELRRTQTAALSDAAQRGAAAPLAVLVIGAAVLVGLIDLSVMERRRTNRVLSVGLLVAGVAGVAMLVWWVLVAVVAGGEIGDARQRLDTATALDDARTAVLQARSNESLVLVARSGGSSSDDGFTAQLQRVLGADGTGGLLAAAAGRAADAGSTARIDVIRTAAQDWVDAHRRVRELDDGGQYQAAVAAATGPDPRGSGVTFERLDAALAGAIEAERAGLTAKAEQAGATLTGLAAGPAVLVLLAAGAVAFGVGRRVEEYR